MAHTKKQNGKMRIRNVFLAGLSLLLAVMMSLAVLAACGGSTGNAKLTLSAGEGGSLTQTEFTLDEGADLDAFLEDKTPTVTVDGLEFAGWFKGNSALGADEKMPAGSLTLTAKYLAPYTLNVYTWDEDAWAYGEPVATEGKAFYHEPLDLLAGFDMPDGYSPDSTKENRTSTASLEVGEAFVLYVRPGEVRVQFSSNAPNGVEVGGEMSAESLSFGETFTVPSSSFAAPKGYRFMGWSKAADGGVDYHAGDTFSAESDVTLYANWEAGKIDVFGGDDFIFLSEEGNAVYLQREGLEEKKGSFDTATSVFSFSEEKNEVLGGKIVEDSFYYFRDLGSTEFKYIGETNEKLTFGEKDEVTYTVTPTDGDPVNTKGVYTVDPETGDYRFVGGNTTSFFFTLFLDPTTRTHSFTRTAEGVGTERGLYALWSETSETGYDATSTLQLDGMYDGLGFASAGLYTLENGKYERQMTTYYGLESVVVDGGEDGVLSADTSTPPINYALLLEADDYYLFRLEEKEFTENGRHFKGVFRLEDGYRGEYGTADEVMAEETSLSLDGFGGAEYKTKGSTVSGAYTIETLEAHGASFEYIAFTPKTGDKLYFQFYSSVVIYYEASEAQPKIVEVSHSLYKTFGSFAGGGGGITLYSDGFLYFYDDVNIAIYTYFTDVFDGETENSIGVDYGTLTETGENGVYSYASILLGEGATFCELRFTKDGEAELSFLLMESLNAGDGANALSVDKWGTLTYGGKTYAYGEYTVNEIYDHDYEDSYVIREYTFGNTVVRVRGDFFYDEGDPDDWQDDTYGYNFNKVLGPNDLLELVVEQYPGQDDFFDRIYFIEGLPTGDETKRAGILLATEDGEEVLLHGDLTLKEDGTYSLELEEPYDDDLMDFYYTYDGISFSIEQFEGRTAAIVYDSSSDLDVTNTDGSSLTFDNFGGATYTPASGEPFTGKYDSLGGYSTDDYTTTTSLIRIVSDAGEEMLFLIETVYDEEWNSTSSFTVVTAEDAGMYSYLSMESGMIQFDLYLVFFGTARGENGGLFVDFTGIYLPDDDADGLGWYVRMRDPVTVSDQLFYEYALYGDKADVDDPDAEPLVYIATAEVDFSGTNGTTGTANVFLERYMPLGDYSIETGGSVVGNGYEYAQYTDADGNVWYGIFGRENLIDDSPRQSEYGVEDGDHSKDGKQLFFYADYVELAEDGLLYELSETRHFLFDVVENENGTWLSARGLLTGTFALFEKGAIVEETLIYFDGHGKATLKKGNVETKGVYTFDEETQEGVFTPESGKGFAFSVYTLRQGGDTWNIFADQSEEYLYLNSDWSVLSLRALGSFEIEDSIYSGVYTDAYGNTHYGFYEYLTDTLVSFETGNTVMYFDLEEKTFSRNTDEFVISGNVLYGYQGNPRRDGLKIPDGVKEIADGVFAYMYFTGEIDLNEVEIIGDRAFYETNIGANTISSEHVTHVGNEAFYNSYSVEFDGHLATNSLANVSFPAAKTIGDRAFYGCNQMAMQSGTITLRDIESIGVQAFLHNINSISGTMTLDLTAVPDLSKVTIDETAFEAGSGSYTPDEAPVIILVSFATYGQIDSLPEEFRDWVQIGDLNADPALTDQGFMSADGKVYYLFTAPKGGSPSVTKYSYDYDWTTEEKAFLWSVEESGEHKTVCLYENKNGAWTKSSVTFALDAATVELGGATCYRTDVSHTLKVSEGDKQINFTFQFTVNVTVTEHYTDVSATVSSATYGEKEADYPKWYSGNGVTFDLVDENDEYNVKVNLANKTATKTLQSRTVLTDDTNYRVTFGNFTESGTPYYLKKLEKKNGESYDLVMDGSKEGQDGKFTYTATTKDAEKKTVTTTVYTVTYTGGFDNPKVTVSESSSVKYEIVVEASEKNKFRATFLAASQDAATVDELTKFEVYRDSDWSEVFGSASYGVTVSKDTEANTFTVTKSDYSGTAVYTVKYVAKASNVDAHIEVTVSALSEVKVNSEHDEASHDDYYELSILVNEKGEVLELKSIGSCSWDFFSGSYESPFGIMLPEEITRTVEANKVTFTFTTLSDDKYTVVIDTTNASKGTYTATVTMTDL